MGVSGGPRPGSLWADPAEPLTARPRAVTADRSCLSLSLVFAIISALEQVSEKSGPVPPPCPLMEGV